MKVTIKSEGSLKWTMKFLKNISEIGFRSILEKYGQKGVEALASATPVDSGETANSWYYEILTSGDGNFAIQWNNSNVNNYVNIALILQYGHGTGTGGYVAGRDYINPAIQPIFDEMTERIWEEVKTS